MALLSREADGEVRLLWRRICAAEAVPELLSEAGTVGEFSMVIVGGGTTSQKLVTTLREALPSIGILVVDEKDTSLQARERYWEHNPRRGWRRLLPASLQTPPEPVDDFVAVILAERVLQA